MLKNALPSLVNKTLSFESFSAYQATLNLEETALFFDYKSIKSSWVNTDVKISCFSLVIFTAYSVVAILLFCASSIEVALLFG